jgi:PIN domain nuclease of toxin-antitoxin system
VNDGNVVADSSALLAALKNEPFSNVDPRELVGATISAVNLCEVLAKLLEDGLSEAQADAAVSAMDLRVVSFDELQAHTTARLRSMTRHAGLSLGDRACLALAEKLGCPVVTADRVWASLDLGLEVVLIR